MYTVSKISATTRNADGSPVLEYDITYRTWRELVVDLAYRQEHANEIFVGRGSLVFRDGEQLGHTDDLRYGGVNEKPIRQITLAEFLAAAAERREDMEDDNV